jgi:hypothetical protein
LTERAAVDLTKFLDGTYESVVPTMFTRTDGVSLLYKGLTHSFHGESESCKSMVAQAEAVQVLMAGGTVLYVDFESDGATVVDRLLTLGASPDAIRGRFSYRKPETKPTTTVLQLVACRR